MKTLGEIAHEAFVKATHEAGYCTYCASWQQMSEGNKKVFDAIGQAVMIEIAMQWGREILDMQERGEGGDTRADSI